LPTDPPSIAVLHQHPDCVVKGLIDKEEITAQSAARISQSERGLEAQTLMFSELCTT
jgi:hypothetical protein